MEPLQTYMAHSKLIKDFVSARQQLTALQHSHATTLIALRKECLNVLNEIFDELRTAHEESVTRHAEWFILDIEECNEKIVVIVRFATKKTSPSLSENTKRELMNLYLSLVTEAEKRFLTLGGIFIIRPISA